MTLVDLLDADKPSVFGALSSTLKMDDKNNVWEEISEKISEQHRHVRTRDEVSKKWYNILSKHKPRIAVKIASARRLEEVQPMRSLMSERYVESKEENALRV